MPAAGFGPSAACPAGHTTGRTAPATSQLPNAQVPEAVVAAGTIGYTERVDEPSLSLVWSAFTGYQRTAAVKAAVELDLFHF